jgi:cytochrome c oxidase subunit 2
LLPLLLPFVLLSWATLAGAEPGTGSTTGLTNIFAPESTPAQMIFEFSIKVLALTGVIFVIVASLLVYAVVKFQGRPEDAEREPAQVYGSTQIELAWTIIPVLIVTVLFLLTARVIHAVQDFRKPPTAIEIRRNRRRRS